MAVEPGALETREEHAQDIDSTQIAGGHQVVSRTIETDYGCDRHDCSTDEGTRNQVK